MLTGVDVADAMRFAADADLVTGRLSGQIDLSGRGTEPAAAVESAEGTARVEIVDGVVRNLGLVRTIVLATSGRADAPPAEVPESRDEPFSRLSATWASASGVARTSDLRFESDDLSLTAAGLVRLDGSAIQLDGRVQLSEELSKQAGRDLVRYTQEEGRVTLPVEVRGTLEAPSVRVDVADLTRRAIQNRATEGVKELLKKRFGGRAPE
jgi:AsmA protein